jgi:hypothetical protein
MRTQLIKYIIPLFLLAAIAGCKKFVEKGDVNVNPNASTQATLRTLLPALIDATSTNHYNVAFTTSMFSQQMAAYQSGPINADRHIDVRMTAFSGLYQAMTNAKILIDLANQQSAPRYSAMGKILLVFNLSLATDTYGDVPFSESFNAPTVLYPKYDKQEDLYVLMQKLLDEAIVESQSTTPGTQLPGNDDLIYKGTMTGWTETAYFLKARLFMHLTKKGAVAAANNALAQLPNAYKSSARDFQLVYNTRNLNPWNANIAKRVETGNFFIAPSRRFTNVLNGTSYTGLLDPRISRMMENRSNPTALTGYSGIPNGTGAGGNVDITQNTFYGRDVAPLMMATFFEQKLLEAEARFLAAGGTITSTGAPQAAYDAYIAGITAHMDKVGVDAVARNSYLASPLVGVTAAGLRLEHIMKEKHIALYLNPEAWVDVRRYDYNPALFRGMALPANHSAAMAGQFIRRSGLPNDELTRNPNAKAASRPQSEKVWWDQ